MIDRKILIVDIDGTVADLTHRIPFIDDVKPDWDSFYEACDRDKPIKEVIEVIESLYIFSNYHIIFITGRDEKVREKTKKWLVKNFLYLEDESEYELLMRKSGDYRKDEIVKPELLKKAGYKPWQITLAFEDRSSVVKTWRKLGIRTLQVADGNF